MGQYFKVVNKTKKEILNPHTFGNGVKLWELVSDGNGVLQGLGLLLAEGHVEYDKNNELKPSTIIGRWHGDSITILGDYAQDKKGDNIYETMIDSNGELKKSWKDISVETYKTLLKDTWIGRRKAEWIRMNGTGMMFGSEKEIMEELFIKECTEGNLRQKYDFVEKEQSEE